MRGSVRGKKSRSLTLKVAQVVACCHGFPCVKAKHVGLLEKWVRGCPRPILRYLLPNHIRWVVKVLPRAWEARILLLPEALAILHIIAHDATPVASYALHLGHLGGLLLRDLGTCGLLLLLRSLHALLHEKIQPLLPHAARLEGGPHACSSLPVVRDVEGPCQSWGNELGRE